MSTPAVTEPVQQTTTRKRGRYARQKNQNMTRNADQSTWLRFCQKYRAEVTNSKQGKEYFKSIKLPDKTRHMAKAYKHFKTVKGLAVAPPKQKEEDSEYNKYVKEFKAAIDSATFTFSDAGNADSHGFLVLNKSQ